MVAIAVLCGHREAHAGDAFGEGQIAWTDAVTGHAHFGQGGSLAGRVGYLYGASTKIGFVFELDLSYSKVSPDNWSWARMLVGPRVLVPVSQSTSIAVDGQFGLDYLASGAYAFQLSAGPRFRCGPHMYVGADLSVIYSHINEIVENYPDPNGTMLVVGANLGASW